MRSSPVTPKCASPEASLATISDAGQEHHLDAGQVADASAIVAGAALLDQRQAGAGEEGGGILLQPALDGAAKVSAALMRSLPLPSLPRPSLSEALDPDREADRRHLVGRADRFSSVS